MHLVGQVSTRLDSSVGSYSLRLVTLKSIYNLVTVKKHRTLLENMNGGSSDYSALAYLSQTSFFVYLIEFVDFDQHYLFSFMPRILLYFI